MDLIAALILVFISIVFAIVWIRKPNDTVAVDNTNDELRDKFKQYVDNV
jgi:flagellar biosynthesis/type III secretory pathway M-ring protein FliF/YscJ